MRLINITYCSAIRAAAPLGFLASLLLVAPMTAFAQGGLRCVDSEGNLVFTQGQPPPGTTCRPAPGVAPSQVDPLPLGTRDRSKARR